MNKIIQIELKIKKFWGNKKARSNLIVIKWAPEFDRDQMSNPKIMSYWITKLTNIVWKFHNNRTGRIAFTAR